MRRIHTLVACVLAFVALSPTAPTLLLPGVSAQDVAVGDAVAVTNEEGTPVGSITVEEVIDPFTGFDPAYPPEAGTRYVALNVAFDADAGERFDIAPYTIVMQDDLGFLWDQASITLPDDAVIPALSSETLAPGSRVTGIVAYAVPEGSEPARVFYQPESSRLVDLAELTDAQAPAVGDTLSIADSEGGTGSVTVTEIADPFEDFDPTQPPPADSRLVAVILAYENTSEGRFFVEPSGLLVRDADGTLWSSTSISRVDETEIVPDLTRTQLAPGDRITGLVAFAVPAETPVDGVYLEPVSGQLVQIADFGQESADTSGASADTASTAVDDETTAAIADACADVTQWLEATRERIARAGALSVEDATLSDLDRFAEHVTEYAQLAEMQLAEEGPPAVEAVDEALAAALNAYADAGAQILGSTEPGKDTLLEVTEGMNTFNEAGARLEEIDAELAIIAGECGLG